jgi:hypothetical protein
VNPLVLFGLAHCTRTDFPEGITVAVQGQDGLATWVTAVEVLPAQALSPP